MYAARTRTRAIAISIRASFQQELEPRERVPGRVRCMRELARRIHQLARRHVPQERRRVTPEPVRNMTPAALGILRRTVIADEPHLVERSIPRAAGVMFRTGSGVT